MRDKVASAGSACVLSPVLKAGCLRGFGPETQSNDRTAELLLQGILVVVVFLWPRQCGIRVTTEAYNLVLAKNICPNPEKLAKNMLSLGASGSVLQHAE